MGHTYRQLPLIEYYAQQWNVIGIFAFWESYNFLTKKYSNNRNIKVIQVHIPWIHGTIDGIDFEKTIEEPINSLNFVQKNYCSMKWMNEFLNVPDIIISDYEPISAQYSYIYGVPLITIDQQSKYFIKNQNISIIEWFSNQEEISRLNLFFPKAQQRIAVSFFNIKNEWFYFDNQVTLCSPIIREEILNLPISFSSQDVLVYISHYSNFVQNAGEVIKIFQKFQTTQFYMYVSWDSEFLKYKNKNSNIHIYVQWDESFLQNLGKAGGIISTAGHNFISEAININKPLYLIPLWTFEQHQNAKIIASHQFGICDKNINEDSLWQFLNNLPFYSENIAKDSRILLKWNGKQRLIDIINTFLHN